MVPLCPEVCEPKRQISASLPNTGVEHWQGFREHIHPFRKGARAEHSSHLSVAVLKGHGAELRGPTSMGREISHHYFVSLGMLYNIRLMAGSFFCSWRLLILPHDGLLSAFLCILSLLFVSWSSVGINACMSAVVSHREVFLPSASGNLPAQDCCFQTSASQLEIFMS